jgi:hypothetical protein
MTALLEEAAGTEAPVPASQPPYHRPRLRIMTSPAPTSAVKAPEAADAESRGWVEDLAGAGPRHEQATARLHALLLRAARFEISRR